MKKNKILALIFLLALGVGLIFHPNQTRAKTAVTIEGCDITITVYLAFAFLDDVSWMNAQQLVDIWVDGMLKIWNEPDFTYGFCECPVHFEVVVEILPKGKDCFDAQKDLPDYHCMHVVNQPVNQRGNVADATIASSQYPNSYGEWATTTTGLNAAHEVGHMMGLGEEYTRDTNGDWKPNQGKEKSIMAKTWGEVKALQEHIDDIVGNAGVDCPMPECCCGNGEHESFIGEECDYKASPTGCPEGQVCDSTCHCKAPPQVTPICGDGYITPPKEECDPKAKPIGCKPDEECIGCKCKKPDEVIPPDETPTTPVCGDGYITPPEQCDPLASPIGCEEGVECITCQCLITETSLISVTPDLLDFGIGVAESSFVIENTGGETLSWEITDDLPEWLSALPMAGETLAGKETTVLVNIDRTVMEPGLYDYKISITSGGGEKVISIIVPVEGEGGL
ncbi:BACON domain-containing protein [Patescibacteria group bacterium]|nr:BACON domain-containing protein [Patescibacteria group bacterium]